MNPELLALKNLQVLDSRIKREEELAKRLPAEIADSEKEYLTAQDKFKQFQAGIEDMKKKRRDLERDAEELKSAIAKTKQKLPEVKTNEQYSAILKEIAAENEKSTKLDEQQLELMYRIEEISAETPKHKAALDLAKEKFDRIKRENEEAVKKVIAGIDELKKTRVGTAAVVSPQYIKAYDKVFSSRGALAVTELKDGNCAGCNQKVMPQLAQDVSKGEKVLACPHCGRFLYLEFTAPASATSTQ